MKAKELATLLEGVIVTNKATIENTFNGVYAGDLLSNVMANAKEDNLFVTIMANINTIGVASLKDLPIIVLGEGKQANDIMIEKANEERIAIIETPKNIVEVIRKIYSNEVLL